MSKTDNETSITEVTYIREGTVHTEKVTFGWLKEQIKSGERLTILSINNAWH